MALKLQAEVGLDGSGFSKTLNALGGSLGGIKSALAGAFSVGAITALAKKTIEYAGHINDLADRLGVTTDYLQEMQFVTKQNGASVDELTATFEKLGAARMKALGGGVEGAKMQQNFSTLGVSVGDLQTKGTSGIMDIIAAQFKQFGDNDNLKTAFKEIGGKGAGVLVPSFIDGLEEGRQKARDAGAVISAESIQKLDMIGDEFDALGQIMISTFAPAIIEVATAITEAVGDIKATLDGLTDWLAQKMGTGADEARKRRDAALSGYKYALDARVGAGELTQEQADKKFKSAAKNSEIGDDLTFTGGVQNSLAQFEKWKAANADAIAAKAARSGDNTANFDTTVAPVKTRQQSSDSLTSVGNFLGSSSGSIVSIARQQLQLTKDQKIILENIHTVLKSLGGLGIGVPPGN